MRRGSGREAKLSYCLNAVMENRNALLVAVQVDQATGFAEREGALDLLDRELAGNRRITLGADKNYDTRDFVRECRRRRVTPHVAQNQHARRRSAIDGRTTARAGYALSSVRRRKIEGIFGWMKTTGNMRKTRYRGLNKTNLVALMTGTAYNLLRIARLVG